MRSRRGAAGAKGSISHEAEKSLGAEENSERNCGTLCLRCLLGFCALIAVAVIIIWALPCPIEPIAYTYSDEPFPEFTGFLAVNDHLKKAKRLFQNEIVGPEAFAVDQEGHVYTGLADGRIIRFENDLSSYTTIARVGKPPYDRCGTEGAEDWCGRVLGMGFHKQNVDELYAIDCSHGLLKVNVQSGEIRTLVPTNDDSGDVPYTNFLNDLVVLTNGSVFFTDSSKKYKRRENRMEVLEGGSHGQLLHYDPTSGQVDVVVHELFFPNGICIGEDEEYLLISETTRARIARYYLRGPKVGTVDIFAENLPGLPDNISPSASGGYWVAFAFTRQSWLLETLFLQPSFRAVIAKLGLMPLLERSVPPHGLLIELDSNGHVLRSLHDQGGLVVGPASHVLDVGDGLLLGSYFAPYLVKLDFLD